MKITKTQANVITITFTKHDNLMVSGDWLTNGHLLLNHKIFLSLHNKIKITMDETNKLFLTEKPFSYKQGNLREGTDWVPDFKRIIDMAPLPDAELKVEDTLIMFQAKHIDKELIFTHATHPGVCLMDGLYKPLLDDRELFSQDKVGWNEGPISCFISYDELYFILMPIWDRAESQIKQKVMDLLGAKPEVEKEDDEYKLANLNKK